MNPLADSPSSTESSSERLSTGISRETLLSLYVPAFILSLGTGIAAPALPIFAKSFGVSFGVASLVLIVYSVGEDDDAGLKASMAAETWPDGSPVFTPLVAASIMVFFALCLQCGSTVAIIAKEIGWNWAIFAFVYMTGLAWIGAVATYQIGGLLFGGGSA